MSQILSYLYIAVGVVFLFGAAIFVHEFGHYWVARRRGLKVEEFAIGFGPPIFSWTKDNILYSLRWIPAGGFVKLPQMITSAALEGGPKPAETTPGAAAAETIPPASALSKILVAAAGPAMNVIFAFALAGLIYFVGLPVHVSPPIIGYINPDSPEGKMGIKEDDKIVAIDGKPVKSWDEIYHTTILALTNQFEVTIVRGATSNNYTIVAESTPGLGKMFDLNPKDHLVVGEVRADSPAEKAGLKPKDEIVSFAGALITSHEQFTNLVQKWGGKPTAMAIKRDEKQVAIEVTPVIDPAPKDPKATNFVIGIFFAPGTDHFAIEHPLPLEQLRDVWDQLAGTFAALVHWKQSGVHASDLAGPVGIASMLAVEVKSDYRLALHFLVMLNLNLAILNMLPIPVLDGGHIVMAIIEKIRRRPMELRFLEYTTTVFAVLLISLMLYITFFDIKRLSLLRMLFNRHTQIEPVEQMEHPAPAPQTTH